MAQDSSLPEFWDTRYRGGVMPWDAAGVPPGLLRWLEGRKAKARILVPGCGTGYEVRALAAHGHDVLAIEFSDAAIEAARRELGALAERVLKADFFAFEAAPFDVIYDRAFMCALPRRLWPQWAARVAGLLRPGGELVGFFYFDDNQRGPPFGVSPSGLQQLLGEKFDLLESADVPASESLPVFKGKEVWQVWRRKI
jgi:SAM-dependent methyltransferase